MAHERAYAVGALVDIAVAVATFVNWLLVCTIVDAVSSDHATRKAASLWLSISSLAVSTWRIYESFRLLGTPRESAASESVVGVFSEIVAVAQTWGVCFLAVRTWQLPASHPFNTDPFLHAAGDSVFEMSLVRRFRSLRFVSDARAAAR